MTRTALLILFLAVLAAPAGAQALPSFNQTRFYDQAAFERAIAPYTAAIARNANDARAHFFLGIAYLHMARFHRFGLAPYARGFDRRAVASLEQALRLQPAAEVMLVLLDAYVMVGDLDRHNALAERLSALAAPLPIR
ncbi:MAG TPA: hypothetical protein VFW08_09870 [bacterium]|nr:hypothetical protein [bacterium]